MSKLYKVLAVILAVSVALVVGFHIGRAYTIRQADLISVTDNEYFIGFGDEIHEYTFD